MVGEFTCRREPVAVGTNKGFSLIEILVAITIGILVLALTHATFTAVSDRARDVVLARATLDRDMNAQRWLRATFLSLDVGTEGAVRFDGQPDRVTFSAWLLTSDGWYARRTVTLARQHDRFVGTSVADEVLVLSNRVDDVAFDYLLEPGADARWAREWVSPLRAPLAVRLRVRKRTSGARNPRGPAEIDTLLFLVKERG